MRRVLGLFAIVLPLAGQVFERAQKLHNEAFVFDGHVHMINRQFYHGGDIGERVPDGQVDLPRAKEGGVDAMFFSVFVTEEYYPARYEAKQVIRLIDLALEQLEKNRGTIALALNASDIERINRGGRMAAVLDLEGGFDLDGDLGVLRSLYRLGLRSAQLSAHNWTNNFADSCCAPPKWRGLNEQGRAVVREMNRLGMLVDVSHVSDATFRDVLEVSSAPVIASHSSCRALCDVPRNLTDEMIAVMAKRGGVVAINFACEYLSQKSAGAAAAFRLSERRAELARRFEGDPEGLRAATQALREEYLAKVPRAAIADVVAHIGRVKEVAGIDHVAIGSDFDGIGCAPDGLDDVSKFPNLTSALLEAGYSPEEIRKIFGENVLRLLRDAERKAGVR